MTAKAFAATAGEAVREVAAARDKMSELEKQMRELEEAAAATEAEMKEASLQVAAEREGREAAELKIASLNAVLAEKVAAAEGSNGVE